MSAAQHPIIDTVIELLEPSELGLELPDSNRLHEAVEGHVGKPDLVEAVRALLVFAFFLEHRKDSPRAAATIIAVLSGYGRAVAAVGAAMDDVVGSIDADAAARRFLGLDGALESPETDAPVMKWWQARR